MKNQQAPIRLLHDPPAAGTWNMAVDEMLLDSTWSADRCTLRFYRWQEPTLSLGYFQSYADRWQHSASKNLPAVRRLSGGGAIVHDNELTYSLTVPAHHPLACDRLRLYQTVHHALVEALAHWGVAAEVLAEPYNLSGMQPFLCFQRRSLGDVLLGKSKIAGSAQRRGRGSVLQHGSVLIARSVAAPELAGICELAGQTVSDVQLADLWAVKIGNLFGLPLEKGDLTEAEQHGATSLVTDKYRSNQWTQNRFMPRNHRQLTTPG